MRVALQAMMTTVTACRKTKTLRSGGGSDNVVASASEIGDKVET